ncbi:MAG: hypothetical protein JST19_05600 [Bacteroidetes bacterium]|nr:hypothetical protein [Bacteroidota bacterium]
MKYALMMILSAAILCSTASCHTGSSVHSGQDTVQSRYGSANDTNGSAKSTTDTSKVNTKSGDASLDNTASGGTAVLKDTAKKAKK